MNRQELVVLIFGACAGIFALLGVATFFASRRFRDSKYRLLWKVSTWSSLSSAVVLLGICFVPTINEFEKARLSAAIKRSVMELERREQEAAVAEELFIAWFQPAATSATGDRFSRPFYLVQVCDVQNLKTGGFLIRPSLPGREDGAYGWKTRFLSPPPAEMFLDGLPDGTRDFSQAKTILFYSFRTDSAAYGPYSKQHASIAVDLQAVDKQDASRFRRIHGSSSPWSSVTFRGGNSAGEGGASQIDGIQQPERLDLRDLFKACVESLASE